MEWIEHLGYFLSGIVIAGVLGAVAQLIGIKLPLLGTGFHIYIKKEGSNGDRV